MKRILLIFVLLTLTFGFTLFAQSTGTIIDLLVDAHWYDAQSDNNGTIHLIWFKPNGQSYYGQIIGDTLVTQELIPVAYNVTTKKARPRISVRPDGKTVHFCWRKPAGDSRSALHCWRDENGVWNLETILNTGSYIAYPALAVDGTGVVHFIFSKYRKESDYLPIIYGRRINGRWVFSQEDVAPETHKHIMTNMVNDPKGGVHAVWIVDAYPIQYRYCEAGGSLLDNPTLSIPGNGFQTKNIDVFVDREDNVHIVGLSWNSRSADQAYADYTIKLAGESEFSVPVHSSIDKIMVQHEHRPAPVVVAASKDLVYVCWSEEEHEGRVNIVGLSTFKDGVWTPETLDHLAAIHEFSKPSLAITNSYVYVIWRNNVGQLTMYKDLTGLGVNMTISPLNGNKVCGTTTIEVEVPASGGEISISQVDLYIDGTVVTTSSTAPFEYEWDTSSITAGTSVQIRAVATFTNSETAESEMTVVKDCPPSVSITEPLDNSTVFAETSIQAEITDDIGVDRAEFFVDNILEHTISVPPYTFTWDPEETGVEKDYILMVKAYDTGSQTGQDEITVSYKKIFPPLSAAGVKKINRSLFFFEYANVLTWQANPQNTFHSISNYRIYLIENGAKTMLGEVDGNTFTYAHRDVEGDGTYTYAIASITAAGDEGGYALVEVN